MNNPRPADPASASVAPADTLRETLDVLRELIVICDPQDAIVYANPRFHEFNAPVADWTRPGITYAEFLKAAVAHGMFPVARDREAAYLESALARRRGEGEWPVEFEYADGRWLLVNFSRLPSGGSITSAIEITPRKRVEQQLHEQTERLLIGQRTARMIVMDWDIRNDVLNWSDSPERIRGPLPAGGKYPLYKDQVHPEDRERFLAVRTRGIHTMERHDQEYRLVRTDGVVLWIRSERVVLPGPDGRAARMLVALHDITARKQAELALQSMNQELERRVAERTAAQAATYRELEAFTYSVSHDLRAPLRAISGFTHLLREEDGAVLSAEGRRFLGVIEGNALRMGALIDALLQLAQNSRQAMARGSIDMSDLARAVADELAGPYPQTQVEIGLMPAAVGDPVLVRQVYTNLIDNALKYSANAVSPRVEIGALPGDAGPTYFVRDNGVGFDMAHAAKLFEPFHRLHADTDYPGDGIGLAVARQIVQRHHGRLWATATRRGGATFSFTLHQEGAGSDGT
jgi:PAS domain S-box-containing protein